MTPPLLARALRTLPVIHQTHWFKAALAFERLKSFFPDLGDHAYRNWLARTEWDAQPRVSGRLFGAVVDPEKRPSARWRRQVQRGMISSAAPSAWAELRERGMEGFFLEFRDEISMSPGYLGHALSVWMGFKEAWPLIEGEEDQALFLERMLEFCASSLFRKTEVEVKEQRTSASFEEAYEASLSKPSFFGHHLITLAWLLRNREWFGEEYFGRACAAILALTEVHYPDEEDNVVLEHSRLASADFRGSLEALLSRGPRDVHAITLGDGLLTLHRVTQDVRLARVCDHFRG